MYICQQLWFQLRAIIPINGFHMLDSFNALKLNGIPLPTVRYKLQYFLCALNWSGIVTEDDMRRARKYRTSF